jgi:protein-tyrosine-phosphatase
MAEGYARALGHGVLEAWSAGSRPSGKVNETAVLMMKEDGVGLGAQASKGLGDLPHQDWDFIVTMGCGDACPSLPAKARRDWDLPDPKHLPPEGFRKVRDDIKSRVLALVKEAS